jgi:hypothetical protein
VSLLLEGRKSIFTINIFRYSTSRLLAIVAVTAKMSLALSLLDEFLFQTFLGLGQGRRPSPVGIDGYGL